MVSRIPVVLTVEDDGTVSYQVAIPAAGDGTTSVGVGGKPSPLPETTYVTLATLPPGIANQVVAKIEAAEGA